MTTHRHATDQGEVTLLIEVTPATVQDETAAPAREWPAERGTTASVVRKATDKAMDAAFETIGRMAQRTAQLIANMQNADDHKMPASLDVEFGVSFTGELQAYIAKAGAEGTISVKLSWTLRPPAE